jgi:hypothetical protein
MSERGEGAHHRMNAALLVPLAHFGHVLVDLPIFFGPVAVLSLWLLMVSRRDRTRSKRERRRG